MLIGRKIMPDFITKAKELGLVKDASPVDIARQLHLSLNSKLEKHKKALHLFREYYQYCINNSMVDQKLKRTGESIKLVMKGMYDGQ